MARYRPTHCPCDTLQGMHGATGVEAAQHSFSTAIPTQLVSSQKWLRVMYEMNIEGSRNLTGAFSIWTGGLHIYVQLSGAKKNVNPTRKVTPPGENKECKTLTHPFYWLSGCPLCIWRHYLFLISTKLSRAEENTHGAWIYYTAVTFKGTYTEGTESWGDML